MKKEILDMSQFEKVDLKTLNDFIKTYEGLNNKESLIPVLYKAQKIFGYLPYNLQRHIALKLDLPSAHVNGVVSFYSYFSEKPVGKNVVSVCMGTACFVKGADKVLDKALKTTNTERNEMSEDGNFTVKDVRCIGACGLAPVVTVNDKVYGKISEKEINDIIEKYMEENDDQDV